MIFSQVILTSVECSNRIFPRMRRKDFKVSFSDNRRRTVGLSVCLFGRHKERMPIHISYLRDIFILSWNLYSRENNLRTLELRERSELILNRKEKLIQ